MVFDTFLSLYLSVPTILIHSILYCVSNNTKNTALCCIGVYILIVLNYIVQTATLAATENVAITAPLQLYGTDAAILIRGILESCLNVSPTQFF